MCVKHASLCFYCRVLDCYRGILGARAVFAARTLATFAARKLLATLVGQPDRYAAGESRRGEWGMGIGSWGTGNGWKLDPALAIKRLEKVLPQDLYIKKE